MTPTEFFTKAIHILYLSLFFITPFLLSITSFELFEFPKMLFVYAITCLVTLAWIGNILVQGTFYWRRSWLDYALGLIVITQGISTLISIHPYTSWYGYYSRFHGGLWSTLCYALLAWGFVQHAQRWWVKNCLLTAMAVASLVSLYAVAEHFGIDAAYWVQDVQNRVYSTLGQPNWLAAWLLTLLPFVMGYFMERAAPRVHSNQSVGKRRSIRQLLRANGPTNHSKATPINQQLNQGSVEPKYLDFTPLFPTFITLNLLSILLSYSLTYWVTSQPLPISGKPFWIFISLLIISNLVILPQAKRILNGIPWLTAINFLLLYALLVSAILYTKSRSGVLALFVGTGVFWLAFFIHLLQSSQLENTQKQSPSTVSSLKKLAKYQILNTKYFCSKFLILNSLFFILIFIIGTEFTPTIRDLTTYTMQLTPTPVTSSTSKSVLLHEESISESTDIRRVVWQGAVDLWKRYPLFGTGTETFAYAYYQVRPRTHNDLSEWDFLYNKAHNEYLNLLANNGTAGTAAIGLLIVGTFWLLLRPHWVAWFSVIGGVAVVTILLGLLSPDLTQLVLTKLLIYPPLLVPLSISTGLAIGLFVLLGGHKAIRVRNPVASTKQLAVSSKPTIHKRQPAMSLANHDDTHDSPAILASLTTILITNFYGFSVVTVSVMFFMVPVFWWVFMRERESTTSSQAQREEKWAHASFISLSFSKPALSWSHVSSVTMMVLLGTGGLCLWILLTIYTYFQADTYYSFSRAYYNQGGVLEANQMIDQALNLRHEADYYLQKALITSHASYVVYAREGTASAQLTDQLNRQATLEIQQALTGNPVHLNHYKNATKALLTLALVDPQYYQVAIKILETARQLAPTDPQLTLNLALIYEALGNPQEAIHYYTQTTELKPNYRRAWIRFAQFYQAQKNEAEAKEIYQWILDNIDPKDVTSLRELKALNGSRLPNR